VGEHPPAQVGNALQALISRLRSALDGRLASAGPDGYRVAIEPAQVDTHRFTRLAATSLVGVAALRGIEQGITGTAKAALGPGDYSRCFERGQLMPDAAGRDSASRRRPRPWSEPGHGGAGRLPDP
jgi:hypothetical protein